jgi:hypothetical protein
MGAVTAAAARPSANLVLAGARSHGAGGKGAEAAGQVEKGPQVHWAQQRAGVRRTDSLHSGQARARSSSVALLGAGAADAGMFLGSA